jgi:predicted nucleic acid-binding protein
MDMVLDASIAAAWVLEDEQNDLADQVIDSLTSRIAVAPHLWALEIANILLVCERRGRIDAAKRKLMAQALCDLGVIEHPHPQKASLGSIMELAAKHRLSSYDTSYLALAIQLELPLATLDAPLRQAAEAEGVSIVKEGEFQ